MAITLKKQSDTARYVLERESCDIAPATFVVGRPTAEERAKLRDMAFSLADGKVEPSDKFQEACLLAVVKHLRGWENVKDDNGDIQFPKRARDAVEKLDIADVNEIGTAIILGEMFAPETLNEDETKNYE